MASCIFFRISLYTYSAYHF